MSTKGKHWKLSEKTKHKMSIARTKWHDNHGRKHITLSHGYFRIQVKNHPKADPYGYVYLHLIIAEHKIGRYLNKNETCHHINGNILDNRPENIEIVKSLSEHRKIHAKETALKESGHIDWRKCKICHQYDEPKNLIIKNRKNNLNKTFAYHKKCHSEYNKKRYHIRREIKNNGSADHASI